MPQQPWPNRSLRQLLEPQRDATRRHGRPAFSMLSTNAGKRLSRSSQFCDNWNNLRGIQPESRTNRRRPARMTLPGWRAAARQVSVDRLIVDSNSALVDEPLRLPGARRHAGPGKDVAEPLARELRGRRQLEDRQVVGRLTALDRPLRSASPRSAPVLRRGTALPARGRDAS